MRRRLVARAVPAAPARCRFSGVALLAASAFAFVPLGGFASAAPLPEPSLLALSLTAVPAAPPPTAA